MADTSAEVVKRYLQDAIATEKGFESQLEAFAKEADPATVKAVFERHLGETRLQIDRLSRRLEELGGSPSAAKSLLAQVFNLTTRVPNSLGQDQTKRRTDDLILAFALENHECALYESLASTVEAAGDPQTAELAKAILAEQKLAANTIWKFLGVAAVATV